MSKERFDIHQHLTDRIVSAIEAGAGEWRMPWHCGSSGRHPVNVASGNKYRGVNVLALWVDAWVACLIVAAVLWAAAVSSGEGPSTPAVRSRRDGWAAADSRSTAGMSVLAWKAPPAAKHMPEANQRSSTKNSVPAIDPSAPKVDGCKMVSNK